MAYLSYCWCRMLHDPQRCYSFKIGRIRPDYRWSWYSISGLYSGSTQVQKHRQVLLWHRKGQLSICICASRFNALCRNSCPCMCVCMHACVHACMHACMRACMERERERERGREGRERERERKREREREREREKERERRKEDLEIGRGDNMSCVWRHACVCAVLGSFSSQKEC